VKWSGPAPVAAGKTIKSSRHGAAIFAEVAPDRPDRREALENPAPTLVMPCAGFRLAVKHFSRRRCKLRPNAIGQLRWPSRAMPGCGRHAPQSGQPADAAAGGAWQLLCAAFPASSVLIMRLVFEG
jgi:hypothetical protein